MSEPIDKKVAMHPHRSIGFAVELIAALVLVVAACGSSSSSKSSAGTAPAGSGGSTAAAVVHIKNFAFVPATIKVKPGEKITFINDDSVVHTATATGGSFDTGDIKPGASATVTPKGTGTIPYICQVHQYMHGTVDVAG